MCQRVSESTQMQTAPSLAWQVYRHARHCPNLYAPSAPREKRNEIHVTRNAITISSTPRAAASP